MRWIRLAADITDDAMTTSDPLSHLVYSDAKRFTGRETTAHDRRTVSPYNHTVKRPPRGGKVQRCCAHVRLQLCGASFVGKAERLGIHRPASNKNGQATPGPAVLVERRIDVDNKALSQA